MCGGRGVTKICPWQHPQNSISLSGEELPFPPSFIGTLSSILSYWPGIQVWRTTEFQQVDPIMRGDQKNMLEELCHQRKAFNPLLHLLLAWLTLHMPRVFKSQVFLCIKRNSHTCPPTRLFPLWIPFVFISFSLKNKRVAPLLDSLFPVWRIAYDVMRGEEGLGRAPPSTILITCTPGHTPSPLYSHTTMMS